MVHLNLVVPGDEEETLSKFSILMEKGRQWIGCGEEDTKSPLQTQEQEKEGK